MEARTLTRLAYIVVGIGVMLVSQWPPVKGIAEVLLIAGGNLTGLGVSKRGVTLPAPKDGV